MKYAIGRTLAELASAAAAVDTWLGVEHINRLGGQPLRGLEDFIEVPFRKPRSGRSAGVRVDRPASWIQDARWKAANRVKFV